MSCQELGTKALDKDQLHQFIVWAGRCAASGELDPSDKQRESWMWQLPRSVMPMAPAISSALGSILNYLSGNKIPSNMPIPPTTIPVAFTANVPRASSPQALG